jgi:hypothetical protein
MVGGVAPSAFSAATAAAAAAAAAAASLLLLSCGCRCWDQVKKAKKKGLGVGGSDDGGSSSDDDADSLRKKIKWNMEPHLSIMRKAVEAALTGKSTTKIADEYSIPARTLRR